MLGRTAAHHNLAHTTVQASNGSTACEAFQLVHYWLEPAPPVKDGGQLGDLEHRILSHAPEDLIAHSLDSRQACTVHPVYHCIERLV